MDETEQMRFLGQKIRQAREKLGLSQEDLAYKWGKKQYQISEYENGKRRIYAHDLPDLANALHVEISYFFQTDNSSTQLNQSEEIIIHLFRNLQSKGTQEFVIKILRELHFMLNNLPND